MAYSQWKRSYDVSFEVSCPWATLKDKLWVRFDNDVLGKGCPIYSTSLETTFEAHPIWFSRQPIRITPEAKYSLVVFNKDDNVRTSECRSHIFRPGAYEHEASLTLVLEFRTSDQDSLSGTWFYRGTSCYILKKVNVQKYLFEEKRPTGVATGLLSQDGAWYTGNVSIGGKSSGWIRVRLANGHVVSNFKRAGDMRWGPDMLGSSQDKCFPMLQRRHEHLRELEHLLIQRYQDKEYSICYARCRLAGVNRTLLEDVWSKKKVLHRLRIALQTPTFMELSEALKEAKEKGLSGEEVCAAHETVSSLQQRIETELRNMHIALEKADTFAAKLCIHQIEYFGASPSDIQHAKQQMLSKSLELVKDARKGCDTEGLKQAIQNAEKVGVNGLQLSNEKRHLESLEARERIRHAALETNVSEIQKEFTKAEGRSDLCAMEEARKTINQLRTDAKKQVRRACDSSRRADLKQAIDNGNRAGLPEQDLRDAVRHLAHLEQRHEDAASSISEGVSKNDFEKLLNGINIAKNIDFEADFLDAAMAKLKELARQALAEAYDIEKQDAQCALKNAIKWCKQAGLKKEDYSHAMKSLQQLEAMAEQRPMAETKLRFALHSCDEKELLTAIELCKKVGFEGAILNSAVQLLERVQKGGCGPDVTAEPDEASESLQQARGTPRKRPPGNPEHCQVSKTPRTKESHVSEGDVSDTYHDAEQGTVKSTTTTLGEFLICATLQQAEAAVQHHIQHDDLGEMRTNKPTKASRSAISVQSNRCTTADDASKDADVQAPNSGQMQQTLSNVDPKLKGMEEKACYDWESIGDDSQTNVEKQNYQQETCDQGWPVAMKAGTQRNHSDNSLVQVSVKDTILKSDQGATKVAVGDRQSLVPQVESLYNTMAFKVKPSLQQGIDPINRSDGSSTCFSSCYQCNKVVHSPAQPNYKWEVHAECNLVLQGDVEVMSAANIASVKAHVEQKGYSGFCVFEGKAYIKHFQIQLERGHLQWMGPGSQCVFYIAVQQANNSYVPPATTNPGYLVDWQHCNSNGHWQNFTREVSAFVEQAYRQGNTKASFCIESGSYEVDFQQMRQFNISKRTPPRYVQRLVSPPLEWKFMWHPVVLDMRLKFIDNAPATMHFGDDIHSDLNTLSKQYIDQLKRSKADEPFFFKIPVWRDIDVDSWLIIAAVSVAIFTVRPRIKSPITLLYSAQDESFKTSMQNLQAELQDTKPLHARFTLPWRSGGYTWLRHAKDTESRCCRLASACSVMRLYSGQLLPTNKVPRCIDSMVKHTQLLFSEDLDLDLLPERQYEVTQIVFSNKPTLLEAALHADCEPCNVAVVNAASGYHVGGGFLTGGRHALEEALCMQSTLYFSLARAVELASEKHDGRGLVDHKGRSIHIPEYGCLLSPYVEIVLEGTDSGYACRPRITCLSAVLSIAMPNKNAYVVDSPFDYRNGKDYEELVRGKFMSIMVGAIRAGATVLVVPDCGCGVFQNNPVRVGSLLREALEQFQGHFDKVILVGSPKFAKAAGAYTNESDGVLSSLANLCSSLVI